MIMKNIAILSIILIVLASLCVNKQPQPSGGDGGGGSSSPSCSASISLTSDGKDTCSITATITTSLCDGKSYSINDDTEKCSGAIVGNSTNLNCQWSVTSGIYTYRLNIDGQYRTSGHVTCIKTPPQKTPEPTSSSVPISVPDTSACAITSPPLSMEGINTHPEVYGTGADPNIITLGPKVGAHPDWQPYENKFSMEFELQRGTPVLAPVDMVLIGVNNRGAAYRIQEGEKVSPFDDLGLYFESASPDWPKMIIFTYHLMSSPLVLKDNQSEIEEWGTVFRAQGHLFYDFTDYMAPENAISCDAMIGRLVKRGELIGFAGNVGTHSMAPFAFKVSHTSENPTVQKGNRYLHWVQPSSFFYWKCYSPDANFPSGVLAYPFECEGYQLPTEQHDVNFKYTSTE